MAKKITISVYGDIPRTPKEQLVELRTNWDNSFLYMKALIQAEKINPNKIDNYDGEHTIEWIKKIAVCDTTPFNRTELIKLFESDD